MSMETADEKKTTWETYSESWAVVDKAERLALFAQCLDVNCVYTDPLVQVTGFEQLVAYMADCHERFPGLHFVLTDFQSHHDRSVSHWQMLNGEKQMLVPGVSFGLYGANGKLVQMSGFFAS